MLLRICQIVPLLVSLPLAAQMHHVDKPEKVTRAVSVYEWTGELAKPSAARLVPVSIFIDGDFQNAGTYLANPVPLALDVGNVYSVERSGHTEGTLDVKLARNVKDARSSADDNPVGAWYGYGEFKLPAQEKPTRLKATTPTVQVAASDDDDRPHFVASRPETTAAPAATPSRRTPVADDDGERPTLGRRDENDTDDKKRKKPKKEKPAGYVTGIPGGLNDDPDRPTLRRGKAVEDEVAPLTGLPAEMHQAIAVSDPATPPEHIFAREWESPSERTQTLEEMQALARKQLLLYLKDNLLVPAPAQQGAAMPAAASVSAPDTVAAPPRLRRTPGGVNTATHTAPAATAKTSATQKVAKPAAGLPLLLVGEQLASLRLSYGGLPTFVYTASAPVALRDGTVVTAYVTVVAQRLPAGNLQVSLNAVTDSGHLNRAPWMRFIDAVDADGSHRASLLFEQRRSASRQFVLYTLVTAKAEATFVSAVFE